MKTAVKFVENVNIVYNFSFVDYLKLVLSNNVEEKGEAS